MQITSVTFKLTQEDVERYRDQIASFPLQNERQILERLPDKLRKIAAHQKFSTFVIDLIRDVEKLYYLLTTSARTSERTRRMILFALNYFIEEKDEIPDEIDVLGYLDDAIIVRWVVDEIKKENPELYDQRQPARR